MDHPDGKLKECLLEEPLGQGEKEVPAGTLPCFDEDGLPKEPCTPMTP
jgi:hypothetical protein